MLKWTNKAKVLHLFAIDDGHTRVNESLVLMFLSVDQQRLLRKQSRFHTLQFPARQSTSSNKKPTLPLFFPHLFPSEKGFHCKLLEKLENIAILIQYHYRHRLPVLLFWCEIFQIKQSFISGLFWFVSSPLRLYPKSFRLRITYLQKQWSLFARPSLVDLCGLIWKGRPKLELLN